MLAHRFVLSVVALLISSTAAYAQDVLSVASPDGNLTIRFSILERLDPPGNRLYYAVRYGKSDVVLESSFGLEFRGSSPFARDLSIKETNRRTVDDSWTRYWGKRKQVRDHCNEATFRLRETSEAGRTIDLVVRAYDDGVAFRYELPEPWGEFELAAEQTAFRFAGNPTVWGADYGGFQSSQERPFVRMRMNELTPGDIYGMPMLVQLAPDRWAAVTEADLTDWAGMYLTRDAGDPGTLLTRLSPHPDEMDVAVRSVAPRSSPWRLIMVGTSPGSFIESDIIQNLNDAPEGDFSWVKPGKSSWDWWTGPDLPDADFEVGKTFETLKAFINLSAEMDWQYVLIDAGWYKSEAGPDSQHGPQSDITIPFPRLHLPALSRYATDQDVGILLWLNWRPTLRQMEKAFPLYESWGIRGVKVDYMNRDDQEMVNFYHHVLQLAAEHHLMVDFHGAYKPTGFSRTYPNLVTREGVMGNEYNKWSDSVTPEHTVTIPFTRGMLGGMDFTPGGFHNKTVQDFEPHRLSPSVMGTRVHQLAMLVVYESALQVLADSPYSYHVSPGGTDFLKIVPTTWDDTKVIAGYPGDYIVIARKSGEAWYVACMTDEDARTVEIPLSFLDSGRYRVEIWADAYEAADFPDRLVKLQTTATVADTLSAVMAPAGGYIARLTK